MFFSFYNKEILIFVSSFGHKTAIFKCYFLNLLKKGFFLIKQETLDLNLWSTDKNQENKPLVKFEILGI